MIMTRQESHKSFLNPLYYQKILERNLVQISYGITVHNESVELERLLGKLLVCIDENDEIVICVDGDDEKVKGVAQERRCRHR